jgi:hypothetical protein
MRRAVEQGLGAHDHTGNAIAALCRLKLDEGLLQGAGMVDRAQAFDGPHKAVADGRDRQQARKDRPVADNHRARAALPKAAAELGAVQLQIVAQGIQQRRRRIDVEGVLHPIYCELDHRASFSFLTFDTVSSTAVH